MLGSVFHDQFPYPSWFLFHPSLWPSILDSVGMSQSTAYHQVFTHSDSLPYLPTLYIWYFFTLMI